MNRHRSSVMCAWFAVFIVAQVLIVVYSKINRGSTQRSANFQTFEGNLTTTICTFNYELVVVLSVRLKKCWKIQFVCYHSQIIMHGRFITPNEKLLDQPFIEVKFIDCHYKAAMNEGTKINSGKTEFMHFSRIVKTHRQETTKCVFRCF